jgi:hypothetical protein
VLRAVGFTDVGNVFANTSSVNLPASDRRVRRRTSAGDAVRAVPRRLRAVAFGTPVRSGRWTFGIGQTF